MYISKIPKWSLLLVFVLLGACTRSVDPVISRFTAEPAAITAGESTTLHWGTAPSRPSTGFVDPHIGSHQARLQPGNLDVTGRFSVLVTPKETTTYTLELEVHGSVVSTEQVTVTVASVLIPQPEPPTNPEPRPDPEPPTNPEPPTDPEPINQAPVATAQSLSANEDAPLAVTLAGSDPDGDTLSYAVTSDPANGVLSGTVPNLTYTPNAEYSGADSFTFTVSDGELTSEAATVDINVQVVNDAPVIATPPAESAATYLSSTYADTLSLTDLDSSSFTLSASVADETVLDPDSFSSSCEAGDCSYSLAALHAGTSDVTITATDDGGATVSATVTVTVLPAVVHSDPVGDFDVLSPYTSNRETDVTQVKTFIDGSDFVLELSYANPDMAVTRPGGGMAIDADRNLATGSESHSYCSNNGGYEFFLYPANGYYSSPAGSGIGTVHAEGNTVTIRVPTSVFGTDPNIYFSLISGYSGPSDCVVYPEPVN